jgi:hypothetical protein
MIDIKRLLSKNKKLYSLLKEKKKKIQRKRNINGKYFFVDNNTNAEKVCIVLAGYKHQLWKPVFARIKKYIPIDIDVCIMTSGVYNEQLVNLCKEYKWSYLSTKRNSVTLCQNIAINKFKNAQYIFKLDEDIFVTENFFENMIDTYKQVIGDGKYDAGFVAPIIPINGYSYTLLLEKMGLVDKYTELFEFPMVAVGPGVGGKYDKKIATDSDVAKFFWGEGNYIPGIDLLNKKFASDEPRYSACPSRFNIGAIMFPRKTWEDMEMFKVGVSDDLGMDEQQICSFCVSYARPMIISENSVVGHFSFGPQTKDMYDFFDKNPERF